MTPRLGQRRRVLVGRPEDAQRTHIFRGGESLCGYWLQRGVDTRHIKPEHPPDDLCRNCGREAGVSR